MAKRHYIPITSDVPGVSDSKCAFIRKVIRTALTAEGVDFPCEIDVELTDDETIHEINREMREVDRALYDAAVAAVDAVKHAERDDEARVVLS